MERRSQRSLFLWKDWMQGALLAVFTLSLAAPAAQSQTLQIDSTTADWIEGFVDFMHWEGAEGDRTVSVAILGANEVAAHLEIRVSARPSDPIIEVLRVQEDIPYSEIDLLFVGEGFRKRWRGINEQCMRHGVLTLSSEHGFLESGGSIQFSIRKNRLVFSVDHANLRASGVRIRSQLLELEQSR